jgi:hypothetical protein
MNFLGFTFNDDGIGPNGRDLLTLSIPGMVYFDVFTTAQDTFGVDQLSFNTPSGVPEPCTFLLIGFGLAGVGLLRRRFKN